MKKSTKRPPIIEMFMGHPMTNKQLASIAGVKPATMRARLRSYPVLHALAPLGKLHHFTLSSGPSFVPQKPNPFAK